MISCFGKIFTWFQFADASRIVLRSWVNYHARIQIRRFATNGVGWVHCSQVVGRQRISILARMIESFRTLRHWHHLLLIIDLVTAIHMIWSIIHQPTADLRLMIVAIDACIEVHLGLFPARGRLPLMWHEARLRRVHQTHLLCKLALAGWRFIPLADQKLWVESIGLSAPRA